LSLTDLVDCSAAKEIHTGSRNSVRIREG